MTERRRTTLDSERRPGGQGTQHDKGENRFQPGDQARVRRCRVSHDLHRRSGHAGHRALAGERIDERAGGREPMGRRLGHGTPDRQIDERRQRRLDGGRGGHFGRQVELHEILHLDRLERAVASEHLEGHDAQRILVSAGIDFFPAPLLGAHVAWGPDHRSGDERRIADAQTFGDTEVGDHGVPAIADQHVGRLDVPVHHSLSMGVVERVCDITQNLEGVLEVERLVAGQHVFEGATAHQAHGVEGDRIALADGKNRHHVRVVEAGGKSRLAFEPRERFGRENGVEGEDLERHLAVERLLVGTEDNAHATAAQ